MPEVGAIVCICIGYPSTMICGVGVVTHTTRCTATVRSLYVRCVVLRKEASHVPGHVYEVYEIVPDPRSHRRSNVFRKTKTGLFRDPIRMILCTSEYQQPDGTIIGRRLLKE